MGNHAGSRPHPGLEAATKRVEARIGTVPVSGRYHCYPKKLEDDYQMEKKVLGTGYNGSVHSAENIRTKEKVAVKSFKLLGVAADVMQDLMTEVEVFLTMDHPHVARLIDAYETKEKLDLVMECLSGGELLGRVQVRKRFSERDAAETAWQMLLAVNYMHSHGVVHRDLKLENFLYDRPDSDHLKLIDFGFSKIWHPNTKMAASCGTLAYVAPEVLKKSYTNQCDMWSLGVTAFIVLFGYMPFAGMESDQVQAIMTGKYRVKQALWDKVSGDAQDFVRKLLVVDPQKRLTAEQALAHPFVAKRDVAGNGMVSEDIVSALVDYGKASAFKRSALLLMSWSLTAEERNQVEQAFLAIDADKKGTITIGEFKKIIEERYHIHDDQATKAFEALDYNHNEEIHYSEFLAAMISSRIAVHNELLMATFRKFDKDDSGSISLGEMKAILGDNYSAQEIDDMLEDIDTSGDGKVDYQEFLAYLRSGAATPEHQQTAACLIDKQMPTDRSLPKLKKRTKEIADKLEATISEHQKCGNCSVL